MNILVIDGQGGAIGRQLVKLLRQQLPHANIRAVGTNATATTAMLKGGADDGATGENAVVVGCRWADVIAGPVGIVLADALLGEVTAAMAAAVGQSNAKRVLIPLNKCGTLVAGVGNSPTADLLADAVDKIRSLTAEES